MLWKESLSLQIKSLNRLLEIGIDKTNDKPRLSRRGKA